MITRPVMVAAIVLAGAPLDTILKIFHPRAPGFGGKVLRQVQMSAIPRAGLQFRGRGVVSHGGNGWRATAASETERLGN